MYHKYFVYCCVRLFVVDRGETRIILKALPVPLLSSSICCRFSEKGGFLGCQHEILNVVSFARMLLYNTCDVFVQVQSALSVCGVPINVSSIAQCKIDLSLRVVVTCGIVQHRLSGLQRRLVCHFQEVLIFYSCL